MSTTAQSVKPVVGYERNEWQRTPMCHLAPAERPTAHFARVTEEEPTVMTRHPIEFRCELCRRRVEDDLRSRARRGWQPLVICDVCLREAASPDAARAPLMAAAGN